MLLTNNINRYLLAITMNEINVQSKMRSLRSKKVKKFDIVEWKMLRTNKFNRNLAAIHNE